MMGSEENVRRMIYVRKYEAIEEELHQIKGGKIYISFEHKTHICFHF